MAATGWSDLPSELLTDIAGGITELADIARFRSVCSSWRSAAGDAAAAPPPQPPWLLLPSSPSRLFFCPREDRIYPDLRLPRPAAEPGSAGRGGEGRNFASPIGCDAKCVRCLRRRLEGEFDTQMHCAKPILGLGSHLGMLLETA